MFFNNEDSCENKDEIKRLFKRLGEVINDTLSHSPEVQEILGQIKVSGLGVDLSMVIGLGLYPRGGAAREGIFEMDSLAEGEIRFELTSADRAFLNRYKIALNLENESAAGPGG